MHCKAPGFSLNEFRLLLTYDTPGRPAGRGLADAKLVEIDARMARLSRATEIIEWAMTCSCPPVDACGCGTEVIVSGSRS